MTRGEMISKLHDEYTHLHLAAQRARDERIERAVSRDPRIGELLGRNADLFHASAARLINRGDVDIAQIVAEMRERAMAISNEIADRLEALGLPQNELDIHYQCADCEDTGYIGELRNTMCACMKQRLMELICADQNMTGLDKQNFSVFDPDIFSDEVESGQSYSPRHAIAAIRARCQRYADSYPDTDKLNLVLMGESGLGKTFLLNCVAERIISRGHTALRVTAFRMLEAMRGRHFGQAEAYDAFDEMINCEILLIDDLGSEPMLRNITIEYLFTLLNERMSARRHTVVATNLSMSDLRERYNERVASRLLDHTNADIFRLIGRDLRQRKI